MTKQVFMDTTSSPLMHSLFASASMRCLSWSAGRGRGRAGEGCRRGGSDTTLTHTAGGGAGIGEDMR